MTRDGRASARGDRIFSKRAGKMDASGIRKVFDKARQIKDPVDLSIGQPHFPVPEGVVAAAFEATRRGMTGYTPTQGLPELREAIRAGYKRDFGVGLDGIDVLVTGGVSGGLTLALLALAGEGDEILIPDPYFVSYKQLACMVGADVAYYDTYPDFNLHPERIEAAITGKTKAIIVGSPANPTGAVASREDLAAVAGLSARRRIALICDEIYSPFVYSGARSTMLEFTDRAIVLDGFSKSHAMAGWRIGFALAPVEIVEQMSKIQQFTFVCAPSFAQAAALAALSVPTDEFRLEYRRKRDMICEGLSENFEIVRPEGAFYVFPKVPRGSDTAFAERALREGLLVIPGSVFSRRGTHLRISYAADDRTILRGMDILNKMAREG